jgi:hypothetical protein
MHDLCDGKPIVRSFKEIYLFGLKDGEHNHMDTYCFNTPNYGSIDSLNDEVILLEDDLVVILKVSDKFRTLRTINYKLAGIYYFKLFKNDDIAVVTDKELTLWKRDFNYFSN